MKGQTNIFKQDQQLLIFILTIIIDIFTQRNTDCGKDGLAICFVRKTPSTFS